MQANDHYLDIKTSKFIKILFDVTFKSLTW